VIGHCGGVGPLQNERKDVKSTALGKMMMMVHLDRWQLINEPLGTSGLKEGAAGEVEK
jgi:hypothetical protein